jgi:hypothetical protein
MVKTRKELHICFSSVFTYYLIFDRYGDLLKFTMDMFLMFVSATIVLSNS